MSRRFVSFVSRANCIRLVLVFACGGLFCGILSAQSASILSPLDWALLPKDAYVGDRVELRCTIAPAMELLPADVDFASREFTGSEIWGAWDGALRQKLSAQQDDSDISVHALSLQRVDRGYSVSLTITPWRLDGIELGYLDLTVLPEVRALVGKNALVAVQLPELRIASLAEKLQTRQLRPVAPPVLVPGSIYVVYALLVAALLLLIALVVVLARFQQVRLFFRGLVSRLRLSRNYRAACRQLRKLSKELPDARTLAARLEAVARIYLENRFARPFTAAATSEIMFILDDIFVGMLSDRQLEAAENLCVVLRRCDYLRYAPAARLEANEGEGLIRSLGKCIDCMEGRE